MVLFISLLDPKNLQSLYVLTEKVCASVCLCMCLCVLMCVCVHRQLCSNQIFVVVVYACDQIYLCVSTLLTV